MLSHFSHVWVFVTQWVVVCQAPLSMGFSRQEYWSGLPCPLPGDLPNPEIEPVSVRSLSLASEYFTTSATLIVQFSTDITHAHRHRHRHVTMNLWMFVDPFTPDASKWRLWGYFNNYAFPSFIFTKFTI